MIARKGQLDGLAAKDGGEMLVSSLSQLRFLPPCRTLLPVLHGPLCPSRERPFLPGPPTTTNSLPCVRGNVGGRHATSLQLRVRQTLLHMWPSMLLESISLVADFLTVSPFVKNLFSLQSHRLRT